MIPTKTTRNDRIHMYAGDVQNVDAVRAFLDRGGNPNDVPRYMNRSGQWAFWTCCFVRAACEDPRASDGPLDPYDWDALWCGSEEMGTAQLCGGNRTLLHWAAFWKSEDVVRLLVERGANVHARSHRGRTPLDVARFYESSMSIRVLLGEVQAGDFFVDGMVVSGLGETSVDGSPVKIQDGKQRTRVVDVPIAIPVSSSS